MHYFNNCGAGLMSPQTLNVIENHLRREIAVGAYRAAQESRIPMEEFYGRVARLLNAASPNDVAFMDSASRAWNMALYGAELRPGDRVLTLSSEFGTNVLTLFHRARQVGASVEVIQCDAEGHFAMDDFAAAIAKGARMVAISHVVAHASIVNPVHEIGQLTNRYGAIYLVDGCQGVGQISVDVEAIQCDAYTGTGRKWLRGPRGTGFLYVKSSAPFRTPHIDLSAADLVIGKDGQVVGVEVRTDARQFELWERSVAGMLGLSSAIGEYLAMQPGYVTDRIQTQADRLRAVVSDNPHLRLLGRRQSESGVIGFYLTEPKREGVVRENIERAGLGISTMSSWDCPLHFPQNGATTIFRLAPHYYTDESSMIAACEVLSQL